MLKISNEDVARVHALQLMRDPWNLVRKPETDEEKEEARSFRLSIRKNGVLVPIIKSKQKDKDAGLYLVAAGWRRVSEVLEAIQKGIFDERDPRAYIPYFNVEGNYFDPKIRFEAVFGDNDLRLNYTYKHIAAIIMDRYPKADIIREDRHGYKSEEVETFNQRVYKDAPFWSQKKVETAITLARKILRPEGKYPDLSDEKISKLNQQFVSWWERQKQINSKKADLQKEIERVDKEIGKILKDQKTFIPGFPKGGPEAYARMILIDAGSGRPSQRSVFDPIKKINGLKKYLTGQDE